MKPTYEQLEAQAKGQISTQAKTIMDLQAQVKHLAAENAGLKSAILAVNQTAEECELNGDELKYVVGTSEFEAMVELLDETPATDAYLSRLRNEARAEIAVMIDGHAARYDALAKQAEDYGVDNRYRFTAAMFRGVAKELREGKAVPESGKQSFVIPDGYALVPNEMFLSSEAMEALCFHCGDGGHMFGEFTDGVLFVGEIEPEESKKVYGLHIATADYPEEGCATICEFLPVLREGKAGEVCSD